MAALHRQDGGIAFYKGDGGEPIPLKGAADSERPVLFTAGDKSLLVIEQTSGERVLTLIDLASGRRQAWKRFTSGQTNGEIFVATPDLKYYSYPFPTYSSVLYTVENLR